MEVQVSDRRLFDRALARFPVKFKDLRNDYGTNVFLRDISPRGARINTREEIHLNDKLDLQVELPDGHEPMALKGRVVWLRSINPKTWDAGMEFDDIDLMRSHRIYKFCQ